MTNTAASERAQPTSPLEGPTVQHGIGVVAPYDFALDREIWRWAPADVSLYIARTPRLRVPVTLTMAEMISDPETIRAGTMSVLTPGPEAVTYLCTSGSFVRLSAGEQELRQAIRDAGSPLAVTSSGALVHALQHLGIEKLAVATPYVDSISERLNEFLEENGVTVMSSAHLGLLGEIWRVRYAEVLELVAAADNDSADAVFVSCTNLPTFDAIPLLEERLGKPVLTANQVSMWASLRAIGAEPPPIEQRLFAETAAN